MTDEKKPPLEAAISQERKLPPSVWPQEFLIGKLHALDYAFGVATRAARVCDETKLMAELERRWDDYALFLTPALLRVPAKLFEESGRIVTDPSYGSCTFEEAKIAHLVAESNLQALRIAQMSGLPATLI